MKRNGKSRRVIARRVAAAMSMTLASCLVIWVSLPDAARGSVPDSIQRAPSAFEAAVELTEKQANSIEVEAVGTYKFRVEKEEIGSVAFDEKVSAAHEARNGAFKFVVANVVESDSPLMRTGQPVQVKILAYGDRVFWGRVSKVGVTVYDSGGNPAVDPNTHRTTARCEVADPENELYPGMLATVAIQVQKPVESVAVPQSAIVREGDGTMVAWVTGDGRHFVRRSVTVGLAQDGYDQIIDGLKAGDKVVTDGAIFISNILYGLPSE